MLNSIRCLCIWIFCICMGTLITAAQTKIVGTVTDENGRILQNVNVSVQSSNEQARTDEGGRFSIRVKADDVLIFRHVGYEVKEMVVGGATPVNVQLSTAFNSLDEVLVIGYGEVSRKDLTGSVSVVPMTDLSKAPVASFTQALAGRVAGVQVSSNDGQPGAGPEINIRGIGSLTQNTSPLYVIDGFPVEDFDPATLNNDDIESLNILKDASATAIYGARAANGVVIVETKKGKIGRPSITLNSSFGMNQVNNKIAVMSPYEFVKYQYELNPSLAGRRYFINERDLESYRTITGIDWHDEVFQTSPYQISNMAIRGGTKETKYSVSASGFDQQGIIPNTGAKRYQARLGLEQSLTSKIKLNVSANYSMNEVYGIELSEETGGNASTYLFSNIWGYRPVTGNPNVDLLEMDVDPDVINANYTRMNPVITAENYDKTTTTNELLANIAVNYKILANLTFNMTGTINTRRQHLSLLYNSLTPQGSPKNPVNVRGINGQLRNLDRNNWSNENTLTYAPSFHKNHKLTITGGVSTQGSQTNLEGLSVQNLPNEHLRFAGFDEGDPYEVLAVTNRFTLASVYGRVNYNFRSRYLFTATYRADGSSKFPVENRWGYFPSVAMAWNVKEEKFLKEINVLSALKLRSSLGSTGNNRVPDFIFLPALNMPPSFAYSFNNATPQRGIAPSRLANRNLKWEITRQADLGIDGGIFNQRINITADMYYRWSENLLLQADVPFITGQAVAYRNIGGIANRGLEITFNTVNFQSKGFNWESSFNISFNRNKITSLTSGQENLFSFARLEGQYNNNPLYIARVGYPAAMFYGYVFDGIYQYNDFDLLGVDTYRLKPEVPTNGDDREQIQPGDIRYKDFNGDGVADERDQVIIGQGFAKHVGGFTNNLVYRSFDFHLFFQWSYGNHLYNVNRLLFEGNGLSRVETNQYASYVNRWTPDNPSNTLYRTGGQGPQGKFSSRTVEDGSYLRLKTVSLGYNFPNEWVKRIGLQTLRLHATGQNVFTFTRYSGMDPEVSVRNSTLTPGYDYSAYPQGRTVVFGLNAAF